MDFPRATFQGRSCRVERRGGRAAYAAGRDAGREPPLDYAYPPNREVNAQLNAEWKTYIKHPALLQRVATLNVPALFVYGSNDIRPSWPVEQVAHLLPNARLYLLPEASHNLWLTHAETLRLLLTAFLDKLDASLPARKQ